mmetsp:Transcript_55648/g.153056  ORF Transcript_55648/g.153056 Transcript_55648/m.153056 type:complete len:212 (-) Transcript_55648:605-1240(-)
MSSSRVGSPRLNPGTAIAIASGSNLWTAVSAPSARARCIGSVKPPSGGGAPGGFSLGLGGGLGAASSSAPSSATVPSPPPFRPASPRSIWCEPFIAFARSVSTPRALLPPPLPALSSYRRDGCRSVSSTVEPRSSTASSRQSKKTYGVTAAGSATPMSTGASSFTPIASVCASMSTTSCSCCPSAAPRMCGSSGADATTFPLLPRWYASAV